MIAQSNLFQYHGRSMWPCFQEGDLLELSPATMATLRKGDCVVFRSDERTVVHRVVAVKDHIVTRGDALPTVDSRGVCPEKLLGKVSYRHRLGRSTQLFGGSIGILAGIFYHYAGRIDPQRDARGGQMARLVRRLIMTFLKLIRCTGRPEKLARRNDADRTFWMLGNYAVGQLNQERQEWSIVWPWNILLDPSQATRK